MPLTGNCCAPKAEHLRPTRRIPHSSIFPIHISSRLHHIEGGRIIRAKLTLLAIELSRALKLRAIVMNMGGLMYSDANKSFVERVCDHILHNNKRAYLIILITPTSYENIK
jgi:hypothetical protein